MIMFTKQELVKLWANDQKRKSFINDYKVWGIWFSQPQLNLESVDTVTQNN